MMIMVTGQAATRTGMRFGLVLTSAYDAATPAGVQIAEHRRLVQMAAELGFDVMMAGQHFLSPSLRYLQPVPYLANLAALAPSLRVATGILLLPLLHPIQVAEDLTTLDVLTGGRAVLGVGIGYADEEFRNFGVDRRTRVRRFAESIEIIRSVWAGGPFHHEGEYWTIDAPPGLSQPVTPGGPPVWVAGQTEAAVRRAARLGDAWYVPPFPTHDELVHLRQVFLEEREAAGRGPEAEFPIRRELFIAPTPAAAMAAVGDQVQGRFKTYVDWGLRRGEDVTSSFTESTEAAFSARFVLGPPEVCAERICRLRDEVGMTTFALKVQWPGLDFEASVRQLAAFGEDVMPLVVSG